MATIEHPDGESLTRFSVRPLLTPQDLLAFSAAAQQPRLHGDGAT